MNKSKLNISQQDYWDNVQVQCEICNTKIFEDCEEYCDRCGAVICEQCSHDPRKHGINSMLMNNICTTCLNELKNKGIEQVNKDIQNFYDKIEAEGV